MSTLDESADAILAQAPNVTLATVSLDGMP